MRNLDILNGVQIPRLDGIEQMLVTYPDVVSGGFTVVRRDADGEHAVALRVRAQRRRPAPLHDRVRRHARARPSQGAVANVDADAVRCQVVNGVDPNPGDGYDENGLEHPRRAEHRPRRRDAAPRPAGASGRRQPRGRRRCSAEVLGELLSRQPVRLDRRVNHGMPPAAIDQGQGESARVTSEARARPRQEDDAVAGGDDPGDQSTGADRAPTTRDRDRTRPRRRRSPGPASGDAPAVSLPLVPALAVLLLVLLLAAARLPLVHPARDLGHRAPATTWRRCRRPAPASST